MFNPIDPQRLPSHVFGPTGRPPSSQVQDARRTLDTFVLDQAHQLADDIGFGWRGALDAPTSPSGRLALLALSAATKQPLPVSSRGLDGSIHLDVEAALAARFWRDLSRLRRCESDGLAAELDLALWQVAVAEANDLPRLSVALLEASLTGQILLRAASGRDPSDELQFTLDVLTYGLADAIVLEAERTTGPAASAPVGR